MGPQAHFENRLEMWSLQDSKRFERRSVQDDGHWAVIDEGNRHPRSEDAPLHRSARIGKRCAETLVERLRLFWCCGQRETRPVALARIGNQRELTDDERRAADVEEAAVELAGGVLEDPQTGDFPGEPFCVRVAVAPLDTEQHDQSGPDLAPDLTFDADARLRDSLANHPHGAGIIADVRLGGGSLEPGDFLEVHARARPHPGWGLPPTTRSNRRYRSKTHAWVTRRGRNCAC
jgi:hypothetical protein